MKVVLKAGRPRLRQACWFKLSKWMLTVLLPATEAMMSLARSRR